jgi:formylglycine-generating enzyme required for sulfatase activity
MKLCLKSYFLPPIKMGNIVHIGVFALLMALSNQLFAGGGKDKSSKDKTQYPAMVFVKGGTFTMGCTTTETSQCNNNETPAHKVTLNDFFIGKFPVTVKEFRKFIKATSYRTTAEITGNSFTVRYQDKGNPKAAGVTWECDAAGNKRDASQDEQPVVHISWDDAQAYCTWLSKETGKKFRLITEAEWEFAARGGNESKGYKFSGGNSFLDIGWFLDNSGNQTHKVGLKQPNELGLYDMNGNVWEWCSDWFNETYYATSPTDNPKGPNHGTYKIMRGGSWNNAPDASNVCSRNYHEAQDRKGTYGFRIAGDSIETQEELEKEAATTPKKKEENKGPMGNYSENNYNFSKVDRIAITIPEASLTSPQAMADYISSKFSSQIDRARAIYTWITENIDYDVSEMNAIDKGTWSYTENEKNQIAKNTLRTGKGVCKDYACLFCSVASRAGLNAFEIDGYIKSSDSIGHAWLAAEIDSKWYLFDPTWGAGYLQNNRTTGHKEFKRKLDDFYFMTSPEDMIKIHMPYDPMWEFLNHPITRDDYYKGIFENKSRPYYNYMDTLNNYINESDFERFLSMYARIKNNGLSNYMTTSILTSNKDRMLHYQSVMAQNLYKDAFYHMNEFIKYRDKKFLPAKPNALIRKMVDDASNSLSRSEKQILEMDNPDAKTKDAMSDLQSDIDNLEIVIEEQRRFLNNYFKTGKFN